MPALSASFPMARTRPSGSSSPFAQSSRFNLNYLHYFVVVAEEMNFRRAAERLHITPQGLSMQIKKLEDMLDVQLFERTHQKVFLTSEGMTLLADAQNLLGQAEQLVHNIRNTALDRRASLRIGIPQFLGQDFITSAIKQYRALYPAEKLDWKDSGTGRDLLAALDSGDIHLGFTHDRWLLRAKGVGNLLVIDSPAHVLMASHHPLAALERIPLSILARQQLVCLNNSWFDSLNLPALFQKKGLPLPNIKKLSNCNLCAIIETGSVTLIAKKQAPALCPKLVYRPLQDADSNFRVRSYAIWAKHAETPQLFTFLNLLKQSGMSENGQDALS